MRTTIPLLWVALAALPAAGQVSLSLEQAQTRSGPDWAPVHEGVAARVAGTVSSKPIQDLGSYYLPIQDGTAHGIWLEGSLPQFRSFVPGDRVVATGIIARRSGMAVLRPAEIAKAGHGAPPEPLRLQVPDVIGLRYLGVLVTVEGRFSGFRENQTGTRLKVAGKAANLTVFLPRSRSDEGPGPLDRFREGDRVRVTGIASQFCPLPPFDKSFQILIGDAGAVAMVEPGALIPSFLLLTATVAICLILSVWWVREHRAGVHRRTLRTLNAAGEQILAAASPSEILACLAGSVSMAHGTGVQLFLYDRHTKRLERVSGPGEEGRLSVNIDSPDGPLATGAALAFRNRTLLTVPDVRRSPFFHAGQTEDMPRSAMFVPMVAQNHILGVLQVHRDAGIRHFSLADQSAAQQLANCAAAALNAQQERSLREQLNRSERIAATGQLISSFARDVRPSMENVLAIAQRLALGDHSPAVQRELRMLTVEAERAAQVLTRVMAYSRADNPEPRAVELNTLVGSLMRSREQEWKALGIEAGNRLCHEPLYTTGSVAQLEQVLLGLLVQAEQCAAAGVAERFLEVSSRSSGRQAMIRFEFGCSPEAVLPSSTPEIRVLRPSPWVAQLEIEFPLWDEAPPPAEPRDHPRTRSLTVLVIEPDLTLQRRIVTDLSHRGYRVVPVSTAEEGLDLIHRVRFEIVFCAARLPGLNWMELHDRARSGMGAFVLMEEVFDDRKLLPGPGDFVLCKAGFEQELPRVIGQVEAFLDLGVLAER